MNNHDKIKQAFSGLKAPDETAEKIMQKYKQRKKHPIFKPAKIIATAAALILIIGLMNIQTVIAFITGLFFIPGAGLTDDINIAYAGLERPVAIETEYGIFSLEFAIKITQNGKTDLSLFLDSQDLPYYGWEKYDISFGLSVKNKMLELEDDKWYGGGWATAGEHHMNFKYTYENFPDLNEFDLIVCGVKTRITLKNKKITDYALSEENNGITMALCKLGEDDLIYQGFFYKNFDNENYSIMMMNIFMGDNYFYDINGDKIQISVENLYSLGGTGFDDGYCIYKVKNDINGIVPKIKGFKSNSVYIDYEIKNPADIEIPVPKDGETIETDIEITFGHYIYKITEVWRKGDFIYFEDNGIIKRETIPKNETTPYWVDEVQIYPGIPEYENAVANRESVIRNVYFLTDEATITNRGRPILKYFNPAAETIKLTPTYASIAQYGNFDVEFN